MLPNGRASMNPQDGTKFPSEEPSEENLGDYCLYRILTTNDRLTRGRKRQHDIADPSAYPLPDPTLPDTFDLGHVSCSRPAPTVPHRKYIHNARLPRPIEGDPYSQKRGTEPSTVRYRLICEDDKFTIRMNHVNGTLDFIDFCDKDQMSMFEIGLMVKELGYDGIVLYHCELPNSASIEKLMFDEDVLKMCECVPGRSIVIKDIRCFDSIPLVPYKTKSNVEQPTNAKGKTVKIVEQEPVEDVGDFSEPEASKNAKGKTVAEAAKKVKAARSSKDKEVAEPEPPKSVRATRSSKGKVVAEPEAPKRARARRVTRSSKGKGVAMESATEGEDSDASLSDASNFVDSEYWGENIEEIAEETIFLQHWIADHAPVKDTFQPLEDEEINEGEGGVVNEGEGPSGNQPLHVGPSGDHLSQAGPSEDHPSQTSQNEDQPLQTGQNREQPSQTMDFHHTDLKDTRLEEGDQAVEEELRSVHSDEDDETVARGKKFKHYNHETDKQNPVFDIGMIFSDYKVFKEAVREYCLLSGKEVTFTRNEKYELKAVCKAASHPWQIYVAWKKPTNRSLVVKYYNPNHNCVRVFENTQASSKWLTEKFLPKIQLNPTMPPQSIVNASSSEFKVGISRMKAYRPKADALRMIERSVAEQYAMLWDYCHELEDKNLGSTTKMQCEFVDGEQLLTAIGIDPNNETWMLASAVVEMETRESWTWFIDLLAKDVDIVNSHGWAFISDKQKGLPGAFEDIVPNAETRFCVKHLWDNFNKTYKGIPCAHGIATIHYKGGKTVEDCVHSYYSKDSYIALYNNLIMPINGSQLWEKTNRTTIKPPAYTRQLGRPRKVRIKGAEDRIDKTGKKWLGRQGMQIRCSICGSTGHNKITHHRNLPQKEKPLSRGKGRPRKISNQDPAVAADEAKVATRVRKKLAYARAKAATTAKKAALNASQPNAGETAGIGLRASKRQRT
ncbi:hypothetical protein L3X38_018135 [Prunus dulcis]|uniref:Uncharacterized protein n=1 Tax=Prunus dulcis TaxID=3755 RepID=A0AAD4W9G7_PRUDU|nr:hypothetical protein L3X38_018135 [Prunus dulcis]